MQDPKKHTHGFKMPKGYLSNFEKDLKISMEENKLPKNSGFEVPKNYFNTIDGSSILAEISKTEPKVISLKRGAIIGLSIAACLAIIFTITNKTTTKTTTLDTIAMTSIEAYLSSDHISISMEDISAEISDDELESLEDEDVLFQEETLEEYLLETIDTYTIINE